MYETIAADHELLDSQGVLRPVMSPKKREQLIMSLVDSKFPEVRVVWPRKDFLPVRAESTLCV